MAFALTVILGIILIAAMSFGALMLSVATLGIGAILCAVICIALAILCIRLRKRLPVKAVLLAESISVAIGIAGFALTQYLEATGFWDGEWFGGLFEMLWALAQIAVALVLLVSTSISLAVVNKRKNKSAALDNTDQT